MNLLVTLNEANIPILRVMLYSLLKNNPSETFDLYLLHSRLNGQNLQEIRRGFDPVRLRLHAVSAGDTALAGAQTSSRYPVEIYYRLFAAQYLPESVSRILYLDPDIIVLQSLRPLYDTDLKGKWIAGACHTSAVVQVFNDIRLHTPGGVYINSGVLLMDLEGLRRGQDPDQLLAYIRKHRGRMMLPDQDVLNALYADRIVPVDPLVYNMTERLMALCNDEENGFRIDPGWVAEHTAVIHYCGRNKPWKKDCIGRLGSFYRQYRQELEERSI